MGKEIIILATSIYSAGGQFTENTIERQGAHSFCLMNCIFDTNPEENIIRFEKCIEEMKPEAVIIDNHWTPDGLTAIPQGLIAFAEKMKGKNVEVFCLNRANGSGFSCELWRFHKPLKFRDMKKPVCHLTRIGIFECKVFSNDGDPVDFGGGDRGIEQMQHAIHNRSVYRERDWPSIIKKVKEEIRGKLLES